MTVFEYVKDVFVNPNLYTKFWVAVATALLSGIALSLTDSPYLPIIINFAGAFSVFIAPNKER